MWESWNEWKDGLENLKQSYMKHRERTEKAAASCMNDRNTERMGNKGKQMQQRDVERLWSFKGLNLTVFNADGRIWNKDDKKKGMLSNNI